MRGCEASGNATVQRATGCAARLLVHNLPAPVELGERGAPLEGWETLSGEGLVVPAVDQPSAS